LEESFKYDPKHLSFTIFDFDGKKFSKVCIDDTSHLGWEEWYNISGGKAVFWPL